MSVNLVANSSFETDTNGDGRADNWGKFGSPVTTLDTTKVHSGSVSQKFVGTAGANEDIRFTPIFITAGQPYTLSVYAWITALNTSPASQAVVKVEWHNNAGNLVNYDYTLISALDSGFVRRSLTSTPGTGAVTAHIILAIEGGGTVYWDDIQLEQASSATSYVAGPATVSPIINLLANTSFEWDTNADGLADGWNSFGTPTTSLDGTIKNFGSFSQKVIGQAGANQDIHFTPIPIIAGQPYTLSVYAFVAALNLSPAGQAVVKVAWQDSSGALVNYEYILITTPDSGFVRRSFTSTPGAGAVTAYIVLAIEGGGTVYWDDIQLEQTASMSPGYLEPDIDWMVRAVYTTSDPTGTQGAISWYVDKVHIHPYEASFAAIAFAAAFRAFHIQKFADIAWGWCAWYRDHMESDGTMYDYDITPLPPATGTTLTKLSTRDSTDSYAGMYLQALRATHLVDPRDLTHSPLLLARP